MSRKYTVINYRLNRKAKPRDVLTALEALIKKHALFYSECLFKVNALIYEFEHEGKLHSNRNKNAIYTILKRYPELKNYYTCTGKGISSSGIPMEVSIENFSIDEYFCTGKIEHNLICDIIKNVPRPYSVNDLELIYNGVGFGEKNVERAKIRHPEGEFDSPVGNYIYYSRSAYGDERHATVSFAIDDENLDSMRKLFFEFAEIIPGKYEGTEYHS